MRDNDKWLSTIDIREYLKNILKVKWFDIVPIDYIKKMKILGNDECLVINLDKSTGSGTHWVCVGRHKNGLYYYDSYGMPWGLSVQKYFNRHPKSLKTYRNTEQVQLDTTGLCGYHCLDFIERLFSGYFD